MNNELMFSSQSNEWETPQALFDLYNAKFNFTLDAAATAANAKCDKFFTEKENGLAQSWRNEIVWLNPPYGRALGKWMEKAFAESIGATIVCLIPARTDTTYWHKFIFGKAEIEFLRGRVKFGQSKTGAPFPSAVVVFRNSEQEIDFSKTDSGLQSLINPAETLAKCVS